MAILEAERQAHWIEKRVVDENRIPDRVLATRRSQSADRTNDRNGMTLPIVDEVGESSSTGGKSGRSNNDQHEGPPPTPPKDRPFQLGPQVPPKEPSIRNSFDSNKALPSLPRAETAEVLNGKKNGPTV